MSDTQLSAGVVIDKPINAGHGQPLNILFEDDPPTRDPSVLGVADPSVATQAVNQIETQTDPSGTAAVDPLARSTDDPLFKLDAFPVGHPRAGGVPAVASEEQHKENPSSFEYWQAEADKAKTAHDNILKKFGAKDEAELNDIYSEYSQLSPIARFIASNPTVAVGEKQYPVFDVVQSALSSGQISGQAPAVQVSSVAGGDRGTSVEQPVKPHKPANYDKLESLNDPDSESFKYRESLDGYYEQIDSYRQSQYTQLQTQLQQQHEAERQKVVVNERNARLRSMGMEDADITQYNQWEQYVAQKAPLEELVKYFNFSRVPPVDIVKNKQRAEELRQQRLKQGIQTPIGTEAAPTQQHTVTEEDAFNLALMGAQGRR